MAPRCFPDPRVRGRGRESKGEAFDSPFAARRLHRGTAWPDSLHADHGKIG